MEHEQLSLRLHKRWLPFIIVGLLFTAYIVVNRLLLGWFIVCPFRALTGYPCPGCGLTHAGKALVKLNFHASFEFHALFLPVALTLAIIFIHKGKSKVIDWAKRQYWWYALLVIAMFAYYGFRLKCCYPGKYPMYRVERYYLGKLEITKRLPEVKRNLEKRLKKKK